MSSLAASVLYDLHIMRFTVKVDDCAMVGEGGLGSAGQSADLSTVVAASLVLFYPGNCNFATL